MSKINFIDVPFDIKKKTTYELISGYFGRTTKFFKWKDNGNVSIYICKINSNVRDIRYLIAIVPIDTLSVGTAITLGNLNWISFQTRTMTENYKIPAQSYNIKLLPIYREDELTLIKRYETRTEYSFKNYPIIIRLLHSQKGLYEFPNTGTLSSALESYCTEIVFV